MIWLYLYIIGFVISVFYTGYHYSEVEKQFKNDKDRDLVMFIGALTYCTFWPLTWVWALGHALSRR